MGDTADKATLNFYDQEAERSAERTGTGSTLALKEFLGRLPHDALILELGSCLLHVPKDRLPEVIARIHRALRPSGILFASFKAGEGEGRDKLGRFFNCLSPILLRTIFEEAAPWASFAIQEATGMGYDGALVTWLNCTAIK
jgi:hypothetical protein